MTASVTDAERIARRYPASRTPRWVWVVLAVFLAVVGGTWMVWSGLYNANPPISAKIVSWQVTGDQTMDVRVTTQRPDPSVPAVCTVAAQAVSYETVGQYDIELAPGTEELEHHDLEIRTFKRATSVKVLACHTR
ncbi:MAG: DUF4307 domain-containing protein [Propionibacteriaceae bacterium]|nr:DUF4307 domain-containing protein [Propionibacteriaceae bacterium]